ncbi:MAG: alcohol dehydrogenase family protein [Alphaproteobacteria bacterium]
MTMRLPKTMTAVLLTGLGGLDRLVVSELSVPEPGTGEVLVRVGACGLNNSDLWIREGAYGSESDPKAATGWRREAPRFPLIQGSDIAGHIVAVGKGVTDRRIGERVLVNPTLYAGADETPVGAGYIGSERPGGFAEYVAVPAKNAYGVQSLISDVELATFPVSYLTAEHMLNRARLAQGETVLVTGASGGVGSALVQLARVRGAAVVALTGRGKEEKVRRLGAQSVVTRDDGSLSAAVAEALGGRLVDVVADVVGGELFGELLGALRPEGRLVTAGAIGGPLVTLDLRTVYLKHLELVGATLGAGDEFAALLRHIEAGRLKPLVAATYPLEDLARAQADFAKKAHFGKIVILPTGA